MNGRFRAQSWALFYETGLLKAVFPEIPHLYSDPVYENLAWVYGMAKGLSGVSAWSLLFLIDTTERRRTPNIEDRLRRLANVSVACRKLKTSRDFEEKLKWIVQAESQLWIGLRDAEIRKTAANAESASLVETVEALSHLTQELPKGFESLMDLVRSGYELPESYLKGEDLLALGLKPGPLFGEILDEGFRLQLEGKLARREQALEWLRSRGQRLH